MPVTVRTLETLIRLATAHAKLRLANYVETSDMDLAGKLLNMTIFNEPMEEDLEPVDEEMEEEEEDKMPAAAQPGKDDIIPLKQKASRAMRNRRRGEAMVAGEEKDEDDILPVSGTSSKRAKVDHDDQVAQLFGAAPIFDDQQKRLVFKMINSLKDSQNKTTTDLVYKRYMGLNERES